MEEAAGESLFDRIGGEAAIAAAAGRFYELLLEDPLTRPFFEELDIAALVQKQVAFLGHAFGAPEEFRGRDLRTAHAQLVRERGLTDVHFDAIIAHLERTLYELHVDPELIDEALAILASTRNEVLGR